MNIVPFGVRYYRAAFSTQRENPQRTRIMEYATFQGSTKYSINTGILKVY